MSFGGIRKQIDGHAEQWRCVSESARLHQVDAEYTLLPKIWPDWRAQTT